MVGPADGLPLVLHEGTPVVHLMPGDGHLSMTVSAFDRILDDLLDLAGLTA